MVLQKVRGSTWVAGSFSGPPGASSESNQSDVSLTSKFLSLPPFLPPTFTKNQWKRYSQVRLNHNKRRCKWVYSLQSAFFTAEPYGTSLKPVGISTIICPHKQTLLCKFYSAPGDSYFFSLSPPEWIGFIATGVSEKMGPITLSPAVAIFSVKSV